MNETIMTAATEQDGMNDGERRRKKLKKRRVIRWGVMILGLLMVLLSARYPLLFSYPLTTLVALGLVVVSGCWMVLRFLRIPEIWAWAKSDESQYQDRPNIEGGGSAKGDKQSLMLVLLLIGLVTAGVGMGMSDTTPVEKQICLEEDYSGDCVEWSEGGMQVTEDNTTKPIAIAGGFIIGLIGLVGIIIVE